MAGVLRPAFGAVVCFALWGIGGFFLHAGPTGPELAMLEPLHEVGVRHAWFTDVWRAVSFLSQPPWCQMVAIAMVTVLMTKHYVRWAIPALVGSAVVMPLYLSLKSLVGRPRPHWDEPLSHSGGLGYPSGHASVSGFAAALVVLVAMLVLVGWVRTVVITGAVVGVVAVGFSRVALGVHSPTDVVGGWLVATGLFLLVVAAARVLGNRFPDSAR